MSRSLILHPPSSHLFFAGPRALSVLQKSPMGRHPTTGRSTYATLQFLSLRSVSLSDKSMAGLAKALYHDRQAAAAKARRSYNDAEPDDDVHSGAAHRGAEDEPEGPRFPALTGLDLTGHHACDAGIVALCQACERLNALKTLRLGKVSERERK